MTDGDGGANGHYDNDNGEGRNGHEKLLDEEEQQPQLVFASQRTPSNSTRVASNSSRRVPLPNPPQSAYVGPSQSPFNMGPRTETADIVRSVGGESYELQPHRSVRSFFSRDSHEKERVDDVNSPIEFIAPQVGARANNNDTEKLLPIVREETEDSDDELPDIKEAVEDLDNDDESSTSEKRRGYKHMKGRNRKVKHKKPQSNFVRKMRNFYITIISKTLITRAFIYWLPLAIILFIPLAVGAWANPNAALGHIRLMWIFIWLEVVWGSLWISRIVAHFLPSIAEVLLGIINPSWRKYATVMAAMEMAITYVFWAFISFITFTPLLSLNHQALKDANLTQPWQKVVNNILVALLISSLIYFAERMFIHMLSVSFHKTRFSARIKTNKQAIHTLALLLQSAYQVFAPFCEEFEEEDQHMENGALLEKSKKLGGIARSVATNQKMQKVVGGFNRVVGTAATAIGSVARDIRGATGHNHVSTYKIVMDCLANKRLSETLANRIWKSLVLEDAEALTIDDLVDVMGVEYEEDAQALFDIVDKDGNGDLSLTEMVVAVQEIGHERKTIYRSLRDMDFAIGKLHSVLMFIVLIIVIIVFIGMLAPSVSAVLATLGSSLLALSFVFSVTAQEILASCVFLFVKHPIDIGDVVTINLPQGVTTMATVEMSLLYSVFRDVSSGALRQAPNAILNTLWIDNISRSGPMSAGFTLHLGLPETTMDDIEKLRSRVDEFLEDNIRDYYPSPYIQITDYPDLDRVSLTISIKYRNNFADGTLFGVRRTKFLQFLGECVNTIPLHIPRRTDTFSNPELPMFSVNASPEGASSKKNGLRQRKPFGFAPVSELVSDENTDDVFSEGPLSPSDQRMQEVAMAAGFRRGESTVSRATGVSGVGRSVSRGMRKRV
jgi:small-conductance mechanosensitive channel